MESIIVALAAGGAALLFALLTAMRVLRAEAGNQRMRAIGDSIKDGAATFLRREYLILAPFVIVVAVMSNGSVHRASRKVKVTIGGCGG